MSSGLVAWGPTAFSARQNTAWRFWENPWGVGGGGGGDGNGRGWEGEGTGGGGGRVVDLEVIIYTVRAG